MLLLFQCITGDGWSALMDDCMITPERGCSLEDGDCGSTAAVPYFVSFVVISSFVFLNLIVAVILENFSALGAQSDDLVSSSSIAVFKEVWAGVRT